MDLDEDSANEGEGDLGGFVVSDDEENASTVNRADRKGKGKADTRRKKHANASAQGYTWEVRRPLCML